MAGNLYSESSAATVKDIYRHCRAGRHQLMRFRADGSRRICSVCSAEFNAVGGAQLSAPIYERQTKGGNP